LRGVVAMPALLVRPDVQLVIEAAVGAPALGRRGRRMRVIPARGVARLVLDPAVRRIAGGKLRVARRGALPVVRRGRRRVVRLLPPLARMTSPAVREWLPLSEQAGPLRPRVAGAYLLAPPRP